MKITFAFFMFLTIYSNGINAQMDDKFYFPSKVLDTIDNVKYEEVLLPIDTDQLSGIFLKPTTKPKATILFFHGAGGNLTKYLFMTRPLITDGYQVFMIDFKGYGKSTGTPTHMNIATDGQKVLNYLLQRKDVKGTKVILYGASIGTQVAVHLAKENINKIDAIILDGTISSFTDVAADHSPVEQREMILKSLPSPYSAKEDIKALIKLPKLFIHSKEDKDVPFKEGELVYNNAPNPKHLFIYQGKHLEVMKLNSEGALKAINSLIKNANYR
jgi:pimeloyl-ACP methyl ester carboxylesterase